MNDTIYIHYGDNEFDKNKFAEIKNKQFWVKPKGGLWASRLNGINSWKRWCIAEEFCLEKLEKYFKFKLKENTRFLQIESSNQLKYLPRVKSPIPQLEGTGIYLDFEKIKEDFDAIEVLISKDNQLYWDLYGWDCDSLLVLNKDVIEIIKE